ncbi:MAG: LPS export ABC transporter permease LptF [Gammaproteobacteria bacterium]|nr:MAG: LPS export ABC transporter permease LptF [Gammaproteobacteria bacterium]
MLVDRYLLREVSVPFVGVSSALLAIFLTYSITSFLAKASGGLLNPGEIAQLTFLKSIIALEVLLPLGLYLGVILGLGRLYSDSEMYALQATGIGEGRLLRPIIMFAVTMAVLISFLSTVARPWAYREAYDLQASAATASELERIKAGRFYVDKKAGRTVFIQSMSKDRHRLEGVFIRGHDDRGLQVASSATGFLEPFVSENRHKLVLVDAHVYKRVDDGPDVLGRFKSLTIFLRIGDPPLVGYKVKAQSTLELRNRQDPHEKAEYEWRLSTSLSTLLLVLVAVPLSRSLPRRGRYGKIMIALLVYALYMNLLTLAKTWVEQEAVGTIWWVPGLLAVVAIVIYLPWRRIMRYRPAKASSADN